MPFIPFSCPITRLYPKELWTLHYHLYKVIHPARALLSFQYSIAYRFVVTQPTTSPAL